MSDAKQPGQWMAQEMAQQPDVLRRLVATRPQVHDQLRGLVPDDLRGVTLVARGSSDNAAIFGRYVIELAARVPVSLAAPSLHTIYGATPRLQGHLVVAVSQSGSTPEIITVLQRCREAGAVTVAITNDPGSALAGAAHATVALEAGEERAVPATKTFSAQVAAFAMVGEALGEVPFADEDWDRLPEAVQQALDDHRAAVTQAERLVPASSLVMVARGLLYPIALEAALKCKESALVQAEGFSVADLRHGPIAVVGDTTGVIAFSAPGPAAQDAELLASEAAQLGATVVRVGTTAAADLQLRVPLPEALQALPSAVRAQQLALALALARGLDPDRPAGLTKVTATF